MIKREEKMMNIPDRKPRRALLVAAACVITLAGAFGLIIQAQPVTGATEAAATTATTERVQIAIKGMHCGGCASGIKARLKRTPGVVSAEVGFEEKQANVEFDPSATSREKIVEAINNLGYKASLKG